MGPRKKMKILAFSDAVLILPEAGARFERIPRLPEILCRPRIRLVQGDRVRWRECAEIPADDAVV